MTDDDTKYLREKLDRLMDSLIGVHKTLERNTVSLEEHIRRTALLEERAEQIDARIMPIERHVTGVAFLMKTIIVVLPVLVAIHKLGYL